jgi:hypothetical protein
LRLALLAAAALGSRAPDSIARAALLEVHPATPFPMGPASWLSS